MKVCADSCRTVEEELEYIDKQFDSIGNFFACDVHPNVVRAFKIRSKRLWDKRHTLMASVEYNYFHLSNYPEISLGSLPQEILDKLDPYKE